MIKSVVKKFIPSFLLNWYYGFFPVFGNILYGFPSKKLTVIGVTGTNGKSTVVEFITSIFQQAGLDVCSISSIRFQIKNKIWQNKLKMTMPGRTKIHRFLRKAVRAGCKYAVIEVTSEGIKQYRHLGIDFKTAVLTNLTKEHIESHGSFENYKRAKGKLFEKAKHLVVNLEDPNSDYFLSFSGKKHPYTKKEFALNLKGDFNLYNASAAAEVALIENISLEDIKRGLERVRSIPGRLEKVSNNIYIDYAHTPDALEKVYQNLEGDLICVLGSCGGGRDKWKRPELGKIASKYCSKIILTNEDPYDEDPGQIVKEIAQGIDKDYEIIIDRKQAIKKALQEQGTVIITGKGREPWMCVKHGKIPWDDKKIVEQELGL